MKIQLSEHFTYTKLLRFTIPSIVMMIFTSSNISMSLVSMLYNFQLLRYAGNDGVAAYGVLMYVSMIFMAAFVGYSVGAAPVISFHYGAGDTDELKSLLRKSIRIILTCSLMMFAAAELLAKPLATIYVSYDEALFSLTLRAFLI